MVITETRKLLIVRERWSSFDAQTMKENFRYCGIQKHRSNEQGFLIDCSILHSVLRFSIEKGTIIGLIQI